jgi:hypothetical protein
MPIDPSVLQRRHWQDGRIRLGVKKISKNGKEYPSKIDTFRFTSPSEEMIQGVAELYGGQVKPWRSPQGPQFEVITDAKRIPVIVPPNGLTQNMELWDGKLCVRRCTGVAMQPPFVGPCLCGADVEIKKRPCKPHTRLGVFLKKIPSLGLWRLDSKGRTPRNSSLTQGPTWTPGCTWPSAPARSSTRKTTWSRPPRTWCPA